MSVGRIRKQPFEQLNASVDFVNVIASGNTLTLNSATAVDQKTGLDSTAQVVSGNPAPAVSGTKVTFRVVGGSDGGYHLITIKVTASDGETFEAEVELVIAEE